MLRQACRLGLVALFACGGDSTPGVQLDGTGTGTSSADTQPADETGASASSLSATSVGATSAASTSGAVVDSTGSSTAPMADSTGSSTGTECGDRLCVSRPQIIDPEPAYDVISRGDLYVTVDSGVRQFAGDDPTAPGVDIPLGGRAQDLLAAWLDAGSSQPDALLVTLPDDDLLAVLPRDASGRIGQPTMHPTGSSPQQVAYLPVATGGGFVTANAGDGTLSRFASPRDGGPLVPMPPIDVGGSPQRVASIDGHLGVLDPSEGVLRILTLDDAFEVSDTESFALDDGPTALQAILYSDIGPPAFLVASGGADLLSVYAADTGQLLAAADYPGFPVAFVFDEAADLVDDQFAMVVALAEADRIAVSAIGGGRQFELQPPAFEFPSAEAPAAVTVADINDDGAVDFVTASPTSGVAVILQQP